MDEWFRLSSIYSHASAENVVDLQLQKDACSQLIYLLDQEYAWGNDPDNLQSLCEKLSPKLDRFSRDVVFSVLRRPV